MEEHLIWIATALFVAFLMELWAGFVHGQMWHGFLYRMHRSHHETTGPFEWNDVLSASHAPIAIVLIVYGCEATPALSTTLAFGVGMGMTLFGLSYLVVHDGFVHRRLPVSFLGRFTYFRKVRAHHNIHHAKGGAPYGFFLPPLRTSLTEASAVPEMS
jgi:beta-carotene 3-hydroxylase